MRIRLALLWSRMATNYVMVPSSFALGALLFACGLVYLELRQPQLNGALPGWLALGGPAGARSMLSAIASSTVTLTGVVFSMVLIVLALASGQYGPRLLRSFLDDRVSQVTLGSLFATVMLSLVGLRAVRDEGHQQFVPRLLVDAALLGAVLSIFALIYFLHHLAQSIRAEVIIDQIGREFDAALARVRPEPAGGVARPADLDEPDDEPAELTANRVGYVEAVLEDQLLVIAEEADLVLAAEVRPGQHVFEGQALARVWPASRLDDALRRRLRRLFPVGPSRTPAQDPVLAVDELVEIAIRALSPGINDTFTALHCIDRLAAAMASLATREAQPPVRCGRDGTIRFRVHPVTDAMLITAAWPKIRDAGRRNPAVLERLAGAFERDAPMLCDELARAAWKVELEAVERAGQELAEPVDRALVDAAVRRAAACGVTDR